MPSGQEERRTASTGGQKGVKLERHDLAPVEPMRAFARVWGLGAEKYEEHNWRRGYPWSWSFGAMMRHLYAFWGGEEIDPESGEPHLAHAMWHCSVLMEFCDIYPEGDDRLSGARVVGKVVDDG